MIKTNGNIGTPALAQVQDASASKAVEQRPVYLAQLEDGRSLYISCGQDGSYESYRAHLGKPGAMVEVEVSNVRRARDGGTTWVTTEAGVFFSPSPLKGGKSTFDGKEVTRIPVQQASDPAIEALGIGKPADAAAPAGHKTFTFHIPMAPAAKVEVVNAGQLTTENLSSILSGSLLSGAELQVADKVAGRRITQEAAVVLAGAFKKSGDTFVYSAAQIDAAKRELLRFWGFPEKFVKAHGAAMQINQVAGSDGALDASGRLTGTIGTMRFEGWINKNDDWRKADIERVVAGFQRPKAAHRLVLTESFFERNGLESKAQRQEATRRLLQALTHWNTVPDDEVTWAKQVLTTGYNLEGSIALEGFAEGKSAVDEAQSIRGLLTGPEGTRQQFTLALATGTLAKAPEGYTLKIL